MFVLGFDNSGLCAKDDYVSLQFDNSTEHPDGSVVESKYFSKGNKMRIEMTSSGEKSIFFSDGEKIYLYFPAENIAMPMPISMFTDAPMFNPRSYKNIPGINKTGEEEINGKLCDVYEYISQGKQCKMWVAKE